MTTPRMWSALETFFCRDNFIHFPFEYDPSKRLFSTTKPKKLFRFYLYSAISRIYYISLGQALFQWLIIDCWQAHDVKLLFNGFIFLFGIVFVVMLHSLTFRLQPFLQALNGVIDFERIFASKAYIIH
jgi:hypothetical protein